MNIINKVGSFFGLVNDETEETVESVVETRQEAAPKKSKVFQITAPSQSNTASSQMKVVILQPTTYSEAQEIVGHLKERKPVVVNLEKVSGDVAAKIIYFLSGAVCALDGSMQKVTAGIILITPQNVSIMSEYGETIKSAVSYDESDV